MSLWFRLVSGVLAVGSISSIAIASQDGNGIATTLSSSGKAGPASIIIDVSAAQVEISRDKGLGYDDVNINAFSKMTAVGEPALSTSGVVFAVPEGYRPQLVFGSADIDAVDSVNVRPTQVCSRCGHNDLVTFAMNEAIYGSDSAYPEQWAAIEDLGMMGAVHLARVGINPARFFPASHQLEIARSMSLRVDFVAIDGARKVHSVVPRSLAQMAAQIAVNSQDVAFAETVSETMLIIADEALLSGLNDFVNWKRRKGLNVVVVTAKEAGSTNTGMKQYIQNFYNNTSNHLAYVLFVGNATAIPPFKQSTSSGTAASDYPFSLLNGTDIVPDVLMGRFVANDLAELKLFTSRALDHETKFDLNAAWYSQGVTIASSEGSTPSDEEYAQMVEGSWKAYTYKLVDRFYQGDGNATKANINKALEEGRTWLTYIGHGSGTSWGSTNGSYSNSSIAELKNTDKLPVIVDVACLNGGFINTGTKLFGKTWVTHTYNGGNAGALAYYGASVSTSWDPPAIMAAGAAKYHFEKPVYSVGATVLAGQIYLIEKSGTGSDVVDNLEWYNLFGDPSLIMRTSTPAQYALVHNVASSANGSVVKVSAQNASGAGIAGLLVSVASADDAKPLAVGYTDASGNAVLNVAASQASLEGGHVTVTGYNYQTQSVVIGD